MDDVATISRGIECIMVITDDGSLWNLNFNFERDYPKHMMSDIVAVSTAFNHVIALGNDGSLWAWDAASGLELGEPIHITDNIMLP